MPPRQALNLNNLKQTPIPAVPTNLQLVNGDGTVTRSGKLLLQQLQASEVLQGTHAGRPNPSDVPDGAVYVESDRTVLYSNINGAWHYIAGTDWGTINPDQRPTDLGVNDAGFDFRTVDDPAREFIWSQAYWVEVTPVRYGTHAARLAVSIPNVIDQMLWVETDRGEVTYQLQAHVWHFIAGWMNGTISPDQRPTDLGANDTGFGFRATDQQRQFYWSGTAWIETTPPAVQAGDVQQSVASSSMTLTTTATTIPGTPITLRRAGRYLLTGCIGFSVATGDNGGGIRGAILANGSQLSPATVIVAPTAGVITTDTQQCLFQATVANQIVAMQAWKDGGSGASTVNASSTSLSALWVSP